VKLRLISLLLTIVMLVLMLPVSVSAEKTTEEKGAEIKKQIRTSYTKCIKASGRSSFDGYCGSYVTWHLYVLGVDRSRHGANGNDVYDQYKDVKLTCGGHVAQAYSAKNYDIESGLNKITANGTMDAYNIVVGFHKTKSEAGQKYGHAVFIHAILDGMVYFSESYDCLAPGYRVAEGQPMVISISRFAQYYNSFSEFEGIVHFGLKSFTPLCDEYPASMTVMTTADATVYEQPFDGSTSQNTVVLTTAAKGSRLVVTGLYQTPEGIHWYQTDVNGRIGYFRSDVATNLAPIQDAVSITGFDMPSVLSKGTKLNIAGQISGGNWRVDNATVRIYDAENNLVREAMVQGSTTDLDITRQLDSTLQTDTLAEGRYRITIISEMTACYVENGQIVSNVATLELHTSTFSVVDVPRGSLNAVASRENWINWLHAEA